MVTISDVWPYNIVMAVDPNPVYFDMSPNYLERLLQAQLSDSEWKVAVALYKRGLGIHGAAIDRGISDMVVRSTRDYILNKLKSVNLTGNSLSIADAGFSSRTINALQSVGILCLADFEGWTLRDLKAIRGIGEKSLEDMINTLASRGIHLEERS